MRFEGKVSVVTGAGQGIGEAYAKGLAAEGAAVVVADLNDAQAERVSSEITAKGGKAIAVKVDVGDPESAQAMAAAASDAFGGIDHLVNNAAIYHSMRIDGLLTVDLDYFNRFMNVNLFGALHCTRACAPSMIGRGGGAIVNQSSTAAWMPGGYYSLAKAGINSLTASLAAELGTRNVRVNGIAPGPTDTDATRSVVPDEYTKMMVSNLAIKRMGTPEDHVGPLLFLLSDDARWITGQVFSVDGGQIVRL
ncbi:MAG TPA: SDR family oxidoreductase [Acidimicrobiales bacterium]|jgi:NAD(P)-dependent dehydrogenase (short-subunit alcohol dehydrogenase family)|nr:SDR family oxidoreductase [Acidimicrobiales bacterium]